MFWEKTKKKEEERDESTSQTKNFTVVLCALFKDEHSSPLHLLLGMQEDNVLLIRERAPAVFQKLRQQRQKKEHFYGRKSLLLRPERPH